MLARISSRELTEWMAFYGLEPFDSAQEEWRAGLIASTVANANRDAKKRSDPYQPADFMREQYKEKPAPLDPDAVRRKIDLAMAMFGGVRDNTGETRR